MTQKIIEFLNNNIGSSLVLKLSDMDAPESISDALCILPHYDKATQGHNEPESLVIFSDGSCFEPLADSTTLRNIGDYYHAMADVVQEIEDVTQQPSINPYEKIFNKDFIKNTVGIEEYNEFINSIKK